MSALDAARGEIKALREQLASSRNYQDAIASFVAAIEADAVLVRERDAALARIEAVETLVAGAESEGQHHVTVESVRHALDPTERKAP